MRMFSADKKHVGYSKITSIKQVQRQDEKIKKFQNRALKTSSKSFKSGGSRSKSRDRKNRYKTINADSINIQSIKDGKNTKYVVGKQEDDYVQSCSSPSDDDISYKDSNNSEREATNPDHSPSKAKPILGYVQELIGKFRGISP